MMHLLGIGRITLKLTSAVPWISIRLLTEHDIPIHRLIAVNDMEIILETDSRYYDWISDFLQKRGDSLMLLHTAGPMFFLTKLFARPVLTGVFLLLTLLVFLLPQKILFYEVEGNDFIPANRILEAAEDCGLGVWANRRDIRSEWFKNQILSEIPELQWAGINTYGSKAIISVRERAVPQSKEEEKHTVSSIYAVCDGIVQAVSAEQGTIHCAEGQTVKKGQLLISGYTNSGFCIRAGRAAGEVFGETVHSLNAVMPQTWIQKTHFRAAEKRYAILIGKKRVNLCKDSGIWDASCDRINKECRLTLPGGYRLPLALEIETITPNSVESVIMSASQAEQILRDAAQTYLCGQMIAGKITSANESIKSVSGSIRLSGIYNSIEMIGREHFEKNGDQYGKNS